MQIDLIRAAEIDPALEATWRGFQSSDPDLKSPFFSPDFARIVGEVRDDAWVAVGHDQGDVRAIFAFHKQALGRLAPLAGQISDYHGVLAAPGTAIDLPAFLKAAGAQAYDFNHAPASQPAFARRAFRETTSPLIDLTQGFEAWHRTKRSEMRSFKDLARRARRLERDHGALRFEANDLSPAAWETFLTWKRDALAAMGVRFILDAPWAREIIERIRTTDSADFAGMTSTLYAGDELVAVHFGMRSRDVFHWWFPAYSEAHRKCSPGLVQIIECARHCADIGIAELDFGRGDQRYKLEFMNASRQLCEGSVERPISIMGAPRRLRKGVQALLSQNTDGKIPDFTRRAGDRLLAAGRIS